LCVLDVFFGEGCFLSYIATPIKLATSSMVFVWGSGVMLRGCDCMWACKEHIVCMTMCGVVMCLLLLMCVYCVVLALCVLCGARA